jgi:hypothetical protein
MVIAVCVFPFERRLGNFLKKKLRWKKEYLLAAPHLKSVLIRDFICDANEYLYLLS